MGVDYDGVGGVGLLLTDERIAGLIESGIFTEDQWGEDRYESLERIGLTYYEAGSANYGGEVRWYLVVDGDTLADVNNNAPAFVEKAKKVGIITTVDELEIISDLLIC